MGNRTKAVEKKNWGGELEISLHARGLSACCASHLPLQGQVSSLSAQSCPTSRWVELAHGPIPARCPPSAHRAALRCVGRPCAAPEPGVCAEK